jgi:hypothetical protein
MEGNISSTDFYEVVELASVRLTVCYFVIDGY